MQYTDFIVFTGPSCISLFSTSVAEVSFTSDIMYKCPEAAPTTASLQLRGQATLVH